MSAPTITILPSGLTVASWPLAGVETVTVQLVADTGSRFEAPAVGGLAHLFEHMVFKGTHRRSARAIAEEMEDVGGQLNAWTSRDATMFHARLLARDLPLGVDLIADLVTGARMAEDDLVREKEVVLQELGEARDTPDDIVFDHLQEVAFPEQALGRSILGDEASLARITRDDLLGWQADHYAPQRLALVAAGKVDHGALCRLAEAAFPARPGPATAGPVGEPARFHPGQHHDSRRIEQAQLTMGWAAPGHHDGAQDAALLFTLAAGGGMSSRLFQQVREERGLAYAVSAALQPYADGGLMSVHAATDPKQAAGARALIADVLHDAAATLDTAELARARAQALAGLLMSIEGPQGAADYLARSLAVHRRFVPPAELVARIEAVGVDEARAAGAAMLAHAPARAEIGRHRAAA